MHIHRFSDPNTSRFWPQLSEIFFLSSSRQKFSSPQEKEEFFKRWTDYYFNISPDQIYLAVRNEQLLGYLMGCFDSQKALSFFRDKIQSYAVFADQFGEFPAHLHINCHPEARGHGVGTRLVEAFCSEAATRKLNGIHIVTYPESRNRDFYLQNRFTFELRRSWNQHELLFMGRHL